MDNQLRRQLRQTISVASPTGVSTSGDFTYGTATTRAARVETHDREVLIADGEFSRSNTLVIVEAEIGINDRIWLPGVSSSLSDEARKPMRVMKFIDELGAVDHFEVWL